MDVLYMIKEDHDVIRSTLLTLKTETAQTARLKLLETLVPLLNERLILYEGYLFPELLDASPASKVVVDINIVNCASLRRAIQSLVKASDKKPININDLNKSIDSLTEQVEVFLSTLEDNLLLKARQVISTQTREDLGQIFHDIKDDLRTGQHALAAPEGVSESKKAGARRLA